MKFINWNKGKTWAHNSIEELQHICSEENPSIFSIHEFNHKKEDDIDDLSIQGYNLILDNMYHKYGMARTAMYIHKDIKFIRRHDLEIEGESLIIITIHPHRSKPVNICSYYRQWQILKSDAVIPGTLSDKAQKMRMEAIAIKISLSITERETICLSDTNIDFNHNYNRPELLKQHQRKLIPLVRIFKQHLFDNGMSIIKTKPTKIYFKKPSTTIDHCMTNFPHKIKSHKLQKSGLSDHLYTVYNWSSIGIKNFPKYIIIRDYSKFNWDQANAEIYTSQNIKTATLSQSPDLIASLIQSTINQVLDNQAPQQKIQISSKVPIFASSETKKLMTDKDDAYARAKTTKNEDDIRNYNNIRNRVRKNLKKDKKNVTKKNLKEINGNPKKQWQSVKKILGWNKFSNPSMIIEDGKNKTSNKEIADSLNFNFIKKKYYSIQRHPKNTNKPP